jgi:enoyl-CoA hydratase
VISFETQAMVGAITLNRPPVNAFDEEMVARLERVVADVAADETLRAVVFRTAQPLFSAGADIKMIAGFLSQPDPGEKLEQFARRMQAVNESIERLPIPTVAAMRGGAIGGGLELALACDFRITSADAKIGLPESTLGLVPGGGGTQRLTRLIGHSNAMRMVLSGQLVDGKTAKDWGIVGWCVPDSDVDSQATQLVESLVQVPRSVIGANKRCVAAAAGVGGYYLEIQMTRQLLGEPAAQELIAHFLSTRTARRARGLARSGQDGAAIQPDGLSVDGAGGLRRQEDA